MKLNVIREKLKWSSARNQGDRENIWCGTWHALWHEYMLASNIGRDLSHYHSEKLSSLIYDCKLYEDIQKHYTMVSIFLHADHKSYSLLLNSFMAGIIFLINLNINKGYVAE